MVEWQIESFDTILNKSGRNDSNRRFLTRLKRALPEREFLAVTAWLSQFYGYQQNWILDPSMASLLLKARQTGATFTYAAIAVLWGFFNEDTVIVSKGQREANLVLKNVAKHLEVLVALGSQWAMPKAASAERIIMGTGAEITSLPPTSGGRGFSANVILDEFAYYDHPDETWDAVGAVTTHHWKLRIMSTPNGMGNPFYVAWKEHRERGYRLHRVTVHDAIADGMNLDVKKLLQVEAKNDPRIFGQLYECKFLDSQYQYLTHDIIDACRTDETFRGKNAQGQWINEYDGPCYGGLDIGRTSDLTVLTTIQKHRTDRKWITRKIQRSRRTSMDDIETMVRGGFKEFNYRKLTIDSTGIGAFPAESLQKKFGISKVEPFVFTLLSKAELATGALIVFSEKRIWIPRKHLEGTDPVDCELLAEDLASIQRVVSDAGNIKYEAPHNANGHADRAWSLFLALNAAINAPTYARM